MLTAAQLEAEAARIGAQLASAALKHPVQVKVETSAQDWHNVLFRAMHEQRMTVWKVLTPIDVIVDGSGQVVGYVDAEAYRRAQPGADTPEGQALALKLVADEELIPAHARVVAVQAIPAPTGGELLAALIAAPEGDERRWIAEVNVARALVASLRPLAPRQNLP